MSAFLDEYGAKDTRREKLRNRLLGALGILAVTGGGLYYAFRNYKEEKRAGEFLELLRNKRYEQAYQVWGCTAEKPCRDYAFDKFLEDWGPKSNHADLSRMRVDRTRSCSGGIIQTLRFGEGDEVLLWVDRADLTLGFAPWPTCNPRYSAPGS